MKKLYLIILIVFSNIVLADNKHSHLMVKGMPLSIEVELKRDGSYKVEKDHKHKHH